MGSIINNHMHVGRFDSKINSTMKYGLWKALEKIVQARQDSTQLAEEIDRADALLQTVREELAKDDDTRTDLAAVKEELSKSMNDHGEQ